MSEDFIAHLGEHVTLAGAALALAVAIGIPLAGLCADRRLPRGLMLALAGGFRVVPSLAVLTLALPLLGLGFRPALLALVVLALPPILLIGFLIGLFFLAAAGQTRLNMANERAHRSQLREQALNEFAGLITDAESAQRGYLLTGESAYLTPYAAAVTRVGLALDRLHDAYGGDESSS